MKLKIGSEKGRGLYAAKDFEIGQTVFRESPIISYISPFTVSEEEQTYCANCGQTLQEPKYRQELSSDLSQVLSFRFRFLTAFQGRFQRNHWS